MHVEMKAFTVEFVSVSLIVLIITAISEYFLIKLFRARQVGQKILEIGPNWHKAKEGTPFMGGLGFIFAALFVMAIFFVLRAVQGISSDYIPLSLTLAFAVANGAIGFVDDYCKLLKKENEGLTSKQKLFLQIVVAAAYVCVMSYTGNLSTAVHLPFGNLYLELGWLFYPIAILVLAGVVNGANLTDGVDGLAGSITCVIAGFFTLVAFVTLEEQISLLAAVLLGGCLGFLIFNFHPAKIFMGDTGSLFLGALVIGTAFQMREPIIGVIISSVFIIEMFSSFLQIFCFKVFNKMRLFRMAPLHHHFEKCGWSEYKIVSVFSFAELLFCILAWFAL